MKIYPKILLGIYACIPTALIVVVIDLLLLNGRIKSSLAVDPNLYPIFTLLFVLPHIISSYFGFIEKEYMKSYSSKLIGGARYVIIGSIIISVIDLTLAFYVFALFTMYHVFRQQSGIARTLMKSTHKDYAVWEWLGVLISFFIYVCIYADFLNSFVMYALLLPTAVYIFYGTKIVKTSKTAIGGQYFWLTLCMPIISGILLVAGYPLFALAIPRVVHDLTAYVFYVSHDNNRFAMAGTNYIYKITTKFALPVYIANPLLSIIFAYLLRTWLGAGAFLTLMIISIIHYYFEGFIWKKDSLHRKYIEYAT